MTELIRERERKERRERESRDFQIQIHSLIVVCCCSVNLYQSILLEREKNVRCEATKSMDQEWIETI